MNDTLDIVDNCMSHFIIAVVVIIIICRRRRLLGSGSDSIRMPNNRIEQYNKQNTQTNSNEKLLFVVMKSN